MGKRQLRSHDSNAMDVPCGIYSGFSLAWSLHMRFICHKIVNDFNDLVSANICGMAFALLKNLQ